ncbi:dihydrofolate reductase [Metabacillus arenae]|uniref:Dihydrofolate reductase n=1 Tax=Metabacillus arenae TaxID=2771434 RepID=A0A926RYW7_9BACI|nr:dihydrofolate reductase [Metabacillus arenae]MBD1381602.1 dihydrofolate reductase [Metabacillus arenae]
MISFMLAMDENRVIGKDNDLPWHLPADLAYFKKTTMGHPIVMGRKTFESIGKPLPGRENIIVTTNQSYNQPGCKVVHSIQELMDYISRLKQEETFIIGGAKLFEGTLPYADRLYITLIHETFDGDTYFPEINQDWRIVSQHAGKKDENNPYEHEFVVYERHTQT